MEDEYFTLWDIRDENGLLRTPLKVQQIIMEISKSNVDLNQLDFFIKTRKFHAEKYAETGDPMAALCVDDLNKAIMKFLNII